MPTTSSAASATMPTASAHTVKGAPPLSHQPSPDRPLTGSSLAVQNTKPRREQAATTATVLARSKPLEKDRHALGLLGSLEWTLLDSAATIPALNRARLTVTALSTA
mmetsp:Transcript_25602/g.46654  ORF Transcript_25602/g.46654 Transcript_25602/m.46654 type:complete len:107 (-) Transcript_25602:423-743(-)